MNSNHKKEILVAVNDAGGANIIASYILANKNRFDFICYAGGPAKKIMQICGIDFYSAPEKRKLIKNILQKHNGVDFLLTGSGWMTKIELNFLIEARLLGMHTVTFIDHWGNYRERFGYPNQFWRKSIPDEIWVGDEFAYKMAKKVFHNVKLRLVRNPYWKSEKEKLKRLSKKIVSKYVLYLSEPSLFSNKVLDLILHFLWTKNFSGIFLIRFHPAEKHHIYDKIIKKYSEKIKIIKSIKNDLSQDLARARVVIGAETMALVISALGRKRTISFIPTQFGRCRLPIKGIIKVRDATGFAKAIGKVW